MSRTHPAARPGTPSSAAEAHSAAKSSPCDPAAVLAAEIAASIRLSTKIGGKLIAEKLGGREDDLPSPEELEEAEAERCAGMVAMVEGLPARSALGAMLQTLLAIEALDNLPCERMPGLASETRAMKQHRRRTQRLLFSVAYFLAGPDPEADPDTRTLLGRYAPRGFHVTEQLERLRAA